jgi:serine/threonine protein phosphatase PrpC
MEVLELLQAATVTLLGEDELLEEDVLGNTALGSALLSASKRIQARPKLLKGMLSPKDTSVFGRSPAPVERINGNTSLSLQVGQAEIPGLRVKMEDASLVHVQSNLAVLAVLDGHDDAGNCSKFCADELRRRILQLDEQGQSLNTHLPDVFLDVDESLKTTDFRGGSTANMAIVKKEYILIANVGDSRCILVQQAKKETEDANPWAVQALSEDHKPNLEAERERIEALGHIDIKEIRYEDSKGIEQTTFKMCKTNKKTGAISELATSRSFGDFEFKRKKDVFPQDQAVTCFPDIHVHERSNQDQLLVLACDGIWDVMTTVEVGDFCMENINRLVDEGTDAILPKVADLLVQECFRRESEDNMSVILVALSDMADKVKSDKAVAKTLDFTDSGEDEDEFPSP